MAPGQIKIHQLPKFSNCQNLAPPNLPTIRYFFVSLLLQQAVKSIPKPVLARLDPNDPNMIIGLPPEPPPPPSLDKDSKDSKKVMN